MGYVAVKGGSEAIEASLQRLKRQRLEDGVLLNAAAVRGGMKVLIDQVMAEASLYDETTASVAIKQAEGSPEEAVFLLRAFRSTLPRLHYSREILTEKMWVERRISASFKDIPGGQILGTSPDYSHRLLDFELMDETEEDVRRFLEEAREALAAESAESVKGDLPGGGLSYAGCAGSEAAEYAPGTIGGRAFADERASADLSHLPKVIDYLRREGLMAEPPLSNREPKDITQETLTFPTHRAERLQILARGQTGAVTAFGYAALRGYGAVLHPTVGELRVGRLPVTIPDPYAVRSGEAVEASATKVAKPDADFRDESGQAALNSADSAHSGGAPAGAASISASEFSVPSAAADPEDDYYIGEILVTEVESLIPVPVKRPHGRTEIEFALGYGICFGRNETKAIAMSILDFNLTDGDKESAVGDEELILLHVDSVEATGFISHLKLPHYVTFQSKLDSVRKARSEGGADDSASADSKSGGSAGSASGGAGSSEGAVSGTASNESGAAGGQQGSDQEGSAAAFAAPKVGGARNGGFPEGGRA